MHILKQLTFLIVLLLNTSIVSSQISAQWRGPERDGKYPDTGLLKSWPEQGPKLLMSLTGVGKGYSQPVVANNIIYVTGIKSETHDILSAFDMQGKLLWESEYGPAWDRSYPETRSTPTVENNRIYLIGGQGMVSCVDAKSGEIIWQKDAHAKYGGEFHRWGVSESVLLTEKAAFYTTGGTETTVIAINKNDGSLLWKTKSLGGERAYASPLLIERGGLKIILAQTANHLLGINAENGEILWDFDMVPLHQGRQGSGAHNNTPLYKNGEIFVTNGYDRLAVMFSLSADGRSISVKWKNDVLDVHHGGVVLIDGNIYGANWLNNSSGKWASIRWDNGKTNWENEWHTKGSVIYADGMMYIYEERSGNVALVRPNPDKLDIVSTFQMKEGEGPHWAHPSIYNRLLFIRHGDVVNVYDIKDNK
jgi:outer membrane protein assembly factor BamB